MSHPVLTLVPSKDTGYFLCPTKGWVLQEKGPGEAETYHSQLPPHLLFPLLEGAGSKYPARALRARLLGPLSGCVNLQGPVASPEV